MPIFILTAMVGKVDNHVTVTKDKSHHNSLNILDYAEKTNAPILVARCQHPLLELLSCVFRCALQ